MSIRILIYVIFCLTLTTHGMAQIQVGTWRDHLSFNEVIDLTHDQSSIIAASEGGLFKFDPVDNSVNKTTQLNGLSDSNISQVEYSQELETLIITYDNGNIDIIRDNVLTNFQELLLNDRIGEKKIHHILFDGSLAYLSGDFGILLLNLETLSVQDSYLGLGVNGTIVRVNSSAILGDSIYAATEEGIIAGSFSDNLKDFNFWRRYSPADNLPAGEGTAIVNLNSELLVSIDTSGLFQWNNGLWSGTGLLTGEKVHSIVHTEKTVITSSAGQFEYISNSLTDISSPLTSQSTIGLFFQGNYWFGTPEDGLIQQNSGTEVSIYPQGPIDNGMVKLVEAKNNIVALPAAYDQSINPLRNLAGMSIFSNEEWFNYRYQGKGEIIEIPEFADITDAFYDQVNNIWYFSSFGYGLLKYESGNFEVIDESTTGSPLENSDPPDRNVFVTSLSNIGTDVSIMNYEANQSLHRLSSGGEWSSFTPSFTNSNKTLDLVTMPWGDHWFILSPFVGGGIIVFNEDGRIKYLTSTVGAGGLPDSRVNDVVLDRENKVWVATARGIVYYPFPEFILDESTTDPVIPIYNFNQLFVNQPVTALAVDGGNRIWMATNQGVWLFANDGRLLIEEFNTENSPLLSNTVSSIALNQSSGEVFFATDAGLVSFRGEATAGIEASNIKIFPNPVTPDFTGIITMEGLPENALVYITDASGRLAYRTKANGNTATWDGRLGSNSSLAPAGVYLVFVSNEGKDRKQVGKIVLIN